MDAKRFDTWTRNRARRLSRRDALRLVGAGGAVAALPILESNALAQGPCSLIIHAETAG
ncbi:MAG: twin-arginine translocation signal domain-containing protein, partial [Thermomicrobiales bacterium]|nr:twin-arginine translocation signal domain-containing protein [Thermomicrobiales bacterium]